MSVRTKRGKASKEFLRAVEEHRRNPKALLAGPTFAPPYDPEEENEMPANEQALAPSVPQVCPNCEEMRRFIAAFLELEAATDDLDSAKNRVDNILGGTEEPFPDDEWNKACDAREAASLRMHKASETVFGFDRARLRALSTLQVQVGGEK